MSRLALVVFASAAGLLARHPASAADPTDWKVLASVNSVAGKPDIPITADDPKDPMKRERGRVFRGPADLAVAVVPDPKKASDPAEQKKAEEWAARMLKVNGIEWTKQMLLAIDAGTFTKPHEVRVVSMKADEKTLTVTWDAAPRGGEGIGDTRALLLVPRFDGEVRFVRADKK